MFLNIRHSYTKTPLETWWKSQQLILLIKANCLDEARLTDVQEKRPIHVHQEK